MKKPAIVSLSPAKRQEVMDSLQETLRERNYPHQGLILEALDFIKILMEELKSGKISTKQLKQILIDIEAGKLKELTQIR